MLPQKNIPFTKEQIEALPKGFTPSAMPNRSFMKKLSKGLLRFDTITGFMPAYKPNCRELTDARKEYKQKKYGRLCGFPTINPLKALGLKIKKERDELANA